MSQYVFTPDVNPDDFDSPKAFMDEVRRQLDDFELTLMLQSVTSATQLLDTPSLQPRIPIPATRSPLAEIAMADDYVGGDAGEFTDVPSGLGTGRIDLEPTPVDRYTEVFAPPSVKRQPAAIAFDASQTLVDTLSNQGLAIRRKPRRDWRLPRVKLLSKAGLKAAAPTWNYLERIGVNAQVHAQTRGADVHVAVIDSGLDPAHPEFANATLLRTASLSYKTDIRDETIDYVQRQPGEKTLVKHYHGSMVAGAVCGGTSGAAPGAGLSVHMVCDGYFYVAVQNSLIMCYRFFKPDIVILSLATPEDRPAKELDELGRLLDAGILIIAAAGNDARKPVGLPASWKGVLAVGATDADDNTWTECSRTELSEDGKQLVKPQIYAPGVALRLPVPFAVSTDGFGVSSGTSFAAPLVAGVAALVISKYKALHNQKLSPAQVISHLIETADDTADRKGRRVNASKALNALERRFPVA